MEIKINSANQIKAKLGLQKNGKTHQAFTLKCKNNMDKFVPMSAGILRKNVDVGSDSITYMTPYARYQYYGKLYVDPETGKGAMYSPTYGFWSRKGVAKINSGKDLVYHTAGTGSFWDKKMWSANGKQIIKELESEIEKGKYL